MWVVVRATINSILSPKRFIVKIKVMKNKCKFLPITEKLENPEQIWVLTGSNPVAIETSLKQGWYLLRKNGENQSFRLYEVNGVKYITPPEKDMANHFMFQLHLLDAEEHMPSVEDPRWIEKYYDIKGEWSIFSLLFDDRIASRERFKEFQKRKWTSAYKIIEKVHKINDPHKQG